MSKSISYPARNDISDRLKDPAAFIEAVDFFEYWVNDPAKGGESVGIHNFVDYAHITGSARQAMHFVLYVEPLLPFDEDLNGDGGDGLREPEVLHQYDHLTYQNLDKTLEEYRDQLMRVITEESTKQGYVRTWVDQPYNIGPQEGYCPYVVKTHALREQLCAVDNAIDLGQDSRRTPFSSQENAQSLSLKLVDHEERGGNIRLYGLRPDDSYTIHGSFYDMRTRNLATEIFALTQLGVRLFVPAEEAMRRNEADSGVFWKHTDAITDAMEELRLIANSRIEYGVVWDQYNYRNLQKGNSISLQLTNDDTVIRPLIPEAQ